MKSKPKVIAEIGCNHMGSFEIAKELVVLAKESGADFVKFQKRCNKELLTDEQYSTPHPVRSNSYGDTYGEHREFLEFSVDQHRELIAYCNEVGIGYSTSVWDTTSAREMIALKPPFLKVPSACNNNFEMLKVLRDDFDGQIQLSVGMTTYDEIEKIISFFEAEDSAVDRLFLYSCTSGYPVPPEDVCLLEIPKLVSTFGKRVNGIGFSGHHLGIALDVAAYALGAEWIERHFTKDRTWKGTDHAASLEPGGLKKLVRDLSATNQALRPKQKEILDIEDVQRKKLKYRE